MMEVTLVHGQIVYNGFGAISPDLLQRGYRHWRDSDAYSTYDDGYPYRRRGGIGIISSQLPIITPGQARRADWRRWRDERLGRVDIMDTRSGYGGGTASSNEPWKLIISYRPAM